MGEGYRPDYQALGLISDVDTKGCVKIPQAMLEAAQIEPGTAVEVFATAGGEIVIRTAEKYCDLCKENGKVFQIGNMQVCYNCIQELQQKAELFKAEG